MNSYNYDAVLLDDNTANISNGAYTFYKDGRMYSHLTNKWLKPHLSTWGYPTYHIKIGNAFKLKSVHKLIGDLFIPNPSLFDTINHIDGNKTNNSIENLEWLSMEDNNKHATINGLNKPANSKLEKEDVLEIRKQYELGLSTPVELSKTYKVSSVTMSRILTRKIWRYI